MKIVVIGAGSIGSVLGARLAATGNDVALLARGAHLTALRARGLTLVDQVGSFSGTHRLPASDEPRELAAGGAADLIFITLKAHQIAAMLPRIAPLVGRDTVVVPAINGLPWWYFYRFGGAHDGRTLRALDPDGAMFAALDPRQIIGCVLHFAAEVRAPGEVQHTSGARIIVGEPDGSDSARLRAVGAALERAQFKVEQASDIRLAVWTKLLGNLSFNPIAALTGYLMNQICADEALLDQIRSMMREGMRVAEHFGTRVPMTPDQRIDMARQLGAAKISMLQDLEQGRPLELAAVIGAVIELAEQADIAVPTIRTVHALAQARARALRLA